MKFCSVHSSAFLSAIVGQDEWSAFWSILRPGHSRINASEIYTHHPNDNIVQCTHSGPPKRLASLQSLTIRPEWQSLLSLRICCTQGSMALPFVVLKFHNMPPGISLHRFQEPRWGPSLSGTTAMKNSTASSDSGPHNDNRKIHFKYVNTWLTLINYDWIQYSTYLSSQAMAHVASETIQKCSFSWMGWVCFIDATPWLDHIPMLPSIWYCLMLIQWLIHELLSLHVSWPEGQHLPGFHPASHKWNKQKKRIFKHLWSLTFQAIAFHFSLVFIASKDPPQPASTRKTLHHLSYNAWLVMAILWKKTHSHWILMEIHRNDVCQHCVFLSARPFFKVCFLSTHD